MRFAQTIVVLIGAVVYAACFVWSQQPDTSVDSDDPSRILAIAVAILIGWSSSFLVATILAIADSVHRVRAAKTRQLATDALVVKIAAIPLFAFNSVALMALFLGGVGLILFGGGVFWLIGSAGIGLTYLAMLSTSVYSWAAIARLRRERVIGTGQTTLYAILSGLIFTDFAVAIMVFGHSRRRPRLALVWVLIATGVTVIAFGLSIILFSWLANSWGLGKGLDYFLGVGSLGWLPIGLIILGIAMILATVIVSFVRRSTLRVEAHHAALTDGASTENDASQRVRAS